MTQHRLLPFQSCFLALATLALAACSLPRVAPPKAHIFNPDQLAGGRYVDTAARQASTEWPGKDWWTSFGDPQLNRLVDQALANAPSILVAKARVDRALAATGSARSALKPTVEAEGKFAYNRFTELEFIPPPFGGGTYWDNQTVLAASIDLDIWGKNHQAIAAAIDGVHAGEAEVAEAREVLAATTVRSYVQLAQQYELKAVLEDTLSQQAKILDIAKKRLHVGLGTELEVAQAESQLPATKAQIDEAEGAIAMLRNQLGALTGQGPGAGDAISKPTLKLGQALQAPTTIPARWIGRRPDVIAQRWRIEADGHDIQVAKARFYPDVNLSAFAGFQALGFEHLFSVAASQYGATPAISLPIFEGGKLQAGLDAASATQDADVASYDETILKAMTEVANQLVTLNTLAAQEKDTQSALALAKKANNLAEIGLKAGLSDYTHVLETEIALLAQQRRLSQLHAQRLTAEVDLIRAVGGAGEVQGPDQLKTADEVAK